MAHYIVKNNKATLAPETDLEPLELEHPIELKPFGQEVTVDDNGFRYSSEPMDYRKTPLAQLDDKEFKADPNYPDPTLTDAKLT